MRLTREQNLHRGTREIQVPWLIRHNSGRGNQHPFVASRQRPSAVKRIAAREPYRQDPDRVAGERPLQQLHGPIARGNDVSVFIKALSFIRALTPKHSPLCAVFLCRIDHFDTHSMLFQRCMTGLGKPAFPASLQTRDLDSITIPHTLM